MARSKRKSKSRKSSSGFGIFCMGLIVGSIGTVLAMGFFDETPLDDVGSGLGSLLNNSNQSISPATESSQTAAVDGQLPGLKFDYPELLLEEEYVLPPPTREQSTASGETTEVAAAPAASNTSTTSSAPTSTAEPAQQPAASKGTAFIIQVGSFRKFEDADRVKAMLAINGHEAYIQKVSIEGRGDFYRVRLGPFNKYEVAEQTTGSLTALQFQPLVFRIKADS